MKLKQRVIMMSSLFLTMATLFLIGIQLTWTLTDPPSHQNQEKTNHIQESIEKELSPTVPSSASQTPSDAVNRFRERFNNHRRPPPPNNELLKDILQKQFGKFPHMGTSPLSDFTPVPIVKIDPWRVWERWVTEDYFYPEGAFYSSEMNQIFEALSASQITELGLGYMGTQLKATMMLGGQRTVFKPKRYSRDKVIDGNPYAGFDRHNGEIAGFHLDGILGFRLAPPVVGRRINLTALGPVITDKLKATFLKRGNNICFYGECYYCKPTEAACADGHVMEGSVTLWLPSWYKLKTRRHPYQRTYRADILARWEKDSSYCKTTVLDQSSEFYSGVLEYTDTAVYDFLMGNADRHHYEVYSLAKPHGKLIHIDNGKTFGNPHHDEVSILAPLTQCCRLRSSTWDTLQSIERSTEKLSEILDKSLRRDSLYPILSQDHLTAIDRRLEIVMTAIRHCIDTEGRNVTIVDSWG